MGVGRYICVLMMSFDRLVITYLCIYKVFLFEILNTR